MAIFTKTALLLMVGWLCKVTNGNVPVVTSVQMSFVNHTRHITLQYEAQDKPVVLWQTMDFITHLENTTNSFSPSGNGTATLEMYISPRTREQGYERNYTLRALIYANSYQISLDIKTGDIRYSQSEYNTIHPITLNVQPAGTIIYNTGSVLDISLSVESEELGTYQMARNWGTLTGFDYVNEPPATVGRHRIPSVEDGFSDECPAFIMPYLNISDPGSTVVNTNAVINTSCGYTEGEIEFGVRLIFDSEHNLLQQITLRRWIYLQDITQPGPFRGKVNFVRDPQNRKREEIIHDRWLYTQADAMGDPKPDIKLFRDCTQLTEPEIEIYSIGTPYRTRKIFRFKNATDSLTGAYYFSVTSGDNEITRMNYMTVI